MTTGDRSFIVTAKLWNELPDSFIASNSFVLFKKLIIKTCLFQSSFVNIGLCKHILF